MNNNDIQQAKEWAEYIFDAVGNGFPVTSSAQDTAQFVKSLPDQIVDGRRLRQIIDFQGASISDGARKDLESLLTPSLPALADMTPEEAHACVGMWCDNVVSTAQGPVPVVLACVQGKLCWVLHTDLYGEWSCFPLDRVVPRPDLMRAWNPDGTPVATTEEVEYRIVDPDTNGGEYELRRWSRHVTEWSTDE